MCLFRILTFFLQEMSWIFNITESVSRVIVFVLQDMTIEGLTLRNRWSIKHCLGKFQRTAFKCGMFSISLNLAHWYEGILGLLVYCGIIPFDCVLGWPRLKPRRTYNVRLTHTMLPRQREKIQSSNEQPFICRLYNLFPCWPPGHTAPRLLLWLAHMSEI